MRVPTYQKYSLVYTDACPADLFWQIPTFSWVKSPQSQTHKSCGNQHDRWPHNRLTMFYACLNQIVFSSEQAETGGLGCGVFHYGIPSVVCSHFVLFRDKQIQTHLSFPVVYVLLFVYFACKCHTNLCHTSAIFQYMCNSRTRGITEISVVATSPHLLYLHFSSLVCF